MGIVIVSVAIALVAAVLAGGHLTAIESVPFGVASLLGAALLCQFAGVVLGHLGAPAGPTYAWACLASAVLVTLAIRIDGALAGTELIAAGLFLNALVVAANANMPVSLHALARAGLPISVATAARHEPAGSGTGLRLLGELIPVPLPFHAEVASIGDLLIAAGLAGLVFYAVRPYGRRDTIDLTDAANARALPRKSVSRRES